MKKNLSFKNLAINIYCEMMLRFSAIFINTYMISHYDTKLLAAMSSANQVFLIAGTVFGFLSVGCSVVLSQALGAGNKNIAIRSVHTAITFSFLIGALCFGLVFIFCDAILNLINVPEDIFSHSKTYLKAMSFVIFLESLCLILSATIRAYGKAKELMIISLLMNFIGVILNALFLYGFLSDLNLGLLGIGISSIIGRLFCLIGFTYIYFYILKLKIYPTLLIKVKMFILKKILKVGGFAAGEGLLWNAQYVMIFSFIATLGSSYLSVQTVYFQISIFVFYAGSAISLANEIIVGRFVGQKEYEKAYKHTFKALFYGLFYGAILFLIVFINKEFILNLVNFNDELKQITRPLFYISIFLECSRTFNIIMVNALRASGDASFPFYMGIIFMWGVSVPLAYILGIYMGYGLSGIWIAFFCDEFLRGVCNTLRWFSKKWQNKALV